MKIGTLLVVAMMAAPALAQGTVDMRFLNTGAGRVLNVEVWSGNTKVYDRNTFAGSLNHQFSRQGTNNAAATGEAAGILHGQTLGTFCTDILESVDSRWRRHQVTEVNGAPMGNTFLSGDIGETRSGRLGQLYSFGVSTGLLNDLGGWSATGGQSNSQAAAFQLLVWELAFDNADDANWATRGVTRFYEMTQAVRDFFVQFRDASRQYGTQQGLRAVARGGSQDQLVIIPLPPAAWAGLGLLGGLAGLSYMRRRSLRA